MPCLSPALLYTRLWVRRANKMEVLSEWNFGEFIHAYKLVSIFTRPDYGSFSFLPPLRHVIVVIISRTSISLRYVQYEIECIEVKRLKLN